MNEPLEPILHETITHFRPETGARQTDVGGAVCVPVRRNGNIVAAFEIGAVRGHEYFLAEKTNRLQDIANSTGKVLK